MVVLSGILANRNLYQAWYTVGHLLHRSQDTTELSRKGGILRMSQLCESVILRVHLDAWYPGFHHVWMLEKIITCEICSYDPMWQGSYNSD